MCCSKSIWNMLKSSSRWGASSIVRNLICAWLSQISNRSSAIAVAAGFFLKLLLMCDYNICASYAHHFALQSSQATRTDFDKYCRFPCDIRQRDEKKTALIRNVTRTFVIDLRSTNKLSTWNVQKGKLQMFEEHFLRYFEMACLTQFRPWIDSNW